jgi:prolipoprotein diacylglyceryltransferase
MDPGDGVPRHPAPLYESLFVLTLGAVLAHGRTRWDRVPGLRFKLFLAAYLLWRLLIDELKPVVVPYAGGASGIQWVCGVALGLYLPGVVSAWRRCHEIERDSP